MLQARLTRTSFQIHGGLRSPSRAGIINLRRMSWAVRNGYTQKNGGINEILRSLKAGGGIPMLLLQESDWFVRRINLPTKKSKLITINFYNKGFLITLGFIIFNHTTQFL